MVKAAFTIGIMLMLSANAWADNLFCATMIAVGKPSTPRPMIIRMRLEIGVQWSRVTGEALEYADLDRIIVACVDDPSASIKHVVRTLTAPKADDRASLSLR